MTRSGFFGLLISLALTLVVLLTAWSYSEVTVTGTCILGITSSPDALIGVPAFGEMIPVITVARGEAGTYVFGVVPRVRHDITLSFVGVGTPQGLNPAYSCNSDASQCRLDLAPQERLDPGVYLVQAQVIAQGIDFRASIDVAIPVEVVFKLPRAENDTAETLQDTPLTVDVLSNDDGDNDPRLTIVSVGKPIASDGTTAGHVRIAPDGVSLEYEPPQCWTGTVVFTYSVRNSSGLDTAAVTVLVVESGEG